MKQIRVLVLSVLVLGAGGFLSTTGFSPAAAQSTATEATRTANFVIENMTCALCPVTVKSAMEAVEGVQSVRIDFAAKTAIVVFDPSVTTPEAIATASTNAGYPATAQS